ncbi:uncharacterized protein V1516DRAFT_680290 [Lipomyces oligophaga]|uniref:uncharacterized protein n=1 Tax=Lipomyces oligophaga TaxID=45792 RepID=UPI0034CE46E7
MVSLGFQLVFLDIDPVLVSCWRNHLSKMLDRSRVRGSEYPLVLESSLKTYDGRFDCIVSPGNSFARMDGGLDLIISRFFSEGKGGGRDGLTDVLDYVRRVHYARWRGLQPVGSCYMIDMLPWMASTGDVGWNRFACRYIAHSPTMRVPSALWREEIVYECMWSVLNEVFNHNGKIPLEQQDDSQESGSQESGPAAIKTVVVTGLGTGTGRMDRDLCARLMVMAFVNFVEALEAGPGGLNEWRWTLAKEWDLRIKAAKTPQ